MAGKRIRRLANAPIVEAVWDIRVATNPETTPNDLVRHYHEISEAYPEKDEGHAIQLLGVLKLQADNPSLPRINDQIDSYRFCTPSRDKMVQFRLDGFTFNQLTPYTEWAQVNDEAWKYWQLYLKSANPLSVKRIALRYINRMSFNSRHWREYLEAPALMGPDVPGSQSRFHFRSEIILGDGVKAMLLQELEPLASTPNVGFVLDIDVSRSGSYPSDSQDLKAFFQELRDYKNEIFFNTLTEKAISQWEEH
jgi:uncharacterized protein (TIGR04255 family)